MAEGVGAVAKAVRILRAFTPMAAQLSVRQLAARTGIPRSTVHGICTALCEGGLLERADGGYRLGTALVALGGQVIDRVGMVEAASGLLDALARRARAEVHLGQLVGGWIVYVARAGPTRTFPMHNRVGMRAPAHLTGCGKAALAFLPVAEALARAASVSGVEQRAVEIDRLAAELAEIQGRGWVFSSAFQAGRGSIAAPVFAAPDLVVGGLSVAGPSDWFSPQVRAAVADLVVETAVAVTAALGGS